MTAVMNGTSTYLATTVISLVEGRRSSEGSSLGRCPWERVCTGAAATPRLRPYPTLLAVQGRAAVAEKPAIRRAPNRKVSPWAIDPRPGPDDEPD